MNRESVIRAVPAALLCLGALFTVGIDRQRAMPLRQPLPDVVPAHVEGLESRDFEVSDAEQQVAGMSEYLFRVYGRPGATDEELAASGVSVYVGYYPHQTQGATIHSPKNCLPGAGWNALESRPLELMTAAGLVTVNQYTLQRDDSRALVLYWYQGRGRIAWNEYRVKWDLLWDAGLRGRSEEALVRIVVPVVETDEAARATAIAFAQELVPAVFTSLPADGEEGHADAGGRTEEVHPHATVKQPMEERRS